MVEDVEDGIADSDDSRDASDDDDDSDGDEDPGSHRRSKKARMIGATGGEGSDLAMIPLLSGGDDNEEHDSDAEM